MRILDKFIGVFSPEAELRRTQARVALRSMTSFEAASVGRRFKNWTPRKKSESLIWRDEGESVGLKAADAVRNNGWAKSAANEFIDTMVGGGLSPRFIDEKNGVVDTYDKSFKIWANRKYCDYEKRRTFWQMQRAIVSTWFVQGEVFLRKIIRENKDPRHKNVRLPSICYQILGPEMIDRRRLGENVVNGIQYDEEGQIEGYYVYTRNPLDNPSSPSELILKEKIIHLYNDSSLTMNRGMSFFSASLKPLRDGDELEDAGVLQRKVSACMTAFLKNVEYTEDGKASYQMPETLEPGGIYPLPPGVDVSFSQPPLVSDFREVIKNQILKSVSSLGLSFESVTKDLSNVNYSSLRGSRNSQEKHIRALRDSTFIPVILEEIAEDILTIMSISTNISVYWIPPSMLLIDPEKEGKAFGEGIRNGIYSLSDVLESFGRTPGQHLSNIKKSNDMLDSLGIVLDSDPRKVSKSGQFQVEDKKED